MSKDEFLMGEVVDNFYSTNVESFVYDLDNKILTIRFLSGSTYEYYNVDQDTAVDFFYADSKGKAVKYLLKLFRYSQV